MTQVLNRTSTASTEVFTTRRVRFFGPRVRIFVAADFRDLGAEGLNNSGKSRSLARPIDLGWNLRETQETRAKLAAFEEDWLIPGMEAYDNL